MPVSGRTRHGLTLVETLVTIAIIGILLSVLLPSLSSARRASRAIMCASNLRQLGMAHYAYAEDHDGVLVPKGLSPSGGAPWWNWTTEDSGMSNAPNFVHYVDNYKTIGSEFLFCPSDYRPYPAEKFNVAVDDPHFGSETSYSVNGWHKRVGRTDEYEVWGPAGNRISSIRSPSEAMLMAETWRWSAIMDRDAIGTGTWDAHYGPHPTRPGDFAGNLEWDDNERHGGILHFLFVDGHVKTRSRAEGVPSAEENNRFWGPRY